MHQTEIVPDDAGLRVARRQRIVAEMDAANIDILIVGREANARYISGVRRLWTAGSRPFGAGCVLLRNGDIHLLSTWEEGIPDDIPRDHLYGISFNSASFLAVLRGLDGAATAQTVATDSLSAGGIRMLAKAFPAAAIVDGEVLLRRARSIKLDDEVASIRAAVSVAEGALAVARDHLAAGVTERQLSGAFMEAIAIAGLTTPATQDVAWITSRDHPWQRTSRDTAVAPGDLVAFEASVILDGYFGEIGRTMAIDGSLDDEALHLLARGDELWERLLAACRPGAAATVLLDTYDTAGVAAPPMPVARGLGLGYDLPLISHDLPASAAELRLQPGMVFTLAAFIWQPGVGAAYGLDPVVITDDGVEVLSAHPFRPATLSQESI